MAVLGNVAWRTVLERDNEHASNGKSPYYKCCACSNIGPVISRFLPLRTFIFILIRIQNRYFEINTNPKLLIAFNKTRFSIYMFINISFSTKHVKKNLRIIVSKKSK